MTFAYDTFHLLIAPPTWQLPEHAAYSFGGFAMNFDAAGISHGVAFGPAASPVTQVLAGGLD